MSVKGGNWNLGDAYELLVCADLLKRGYHVFRSVSHTGPCDLIMLAGERTYRVEVKGTGHARPNANFDILANVSDNGIRYQPELPPLRIPKEPRSTFTQIRKGVV